MEVFFQNAGKRISITISDPWDFVTSNGSTRTGTLIRDLNVPHDVATIQLDDTLRAGGAEVDKVFAKFRHIGAAGSDFLHGKEVACNFSTDIGDGTLSASKGAVAFIGSLKLLSI
jgi:hypothetical protein